VRSVSRMDGRLKEAAKLGFRRALAPADADGGAGMAVTGASRLADAVQRIVDGVWDPHPTGSIR
jgi:DNA repair protein RadA/Sms